MSVTAVEDVSPKSHKKPKKSKSAGAHADPEDVDLEARAKPKKRKHREATSDVLSIDPHTDQAPTIQDSSACDPSYPLNSPGPGDVTSNNAQIADSATDRSKDGSRKEKEKKTKKTKKKKHLDEGKQEGVEKSDDTKVPTMEEAASKIQQKKRKRSADGQSEDTLSATKPRKKKKDHGPTDILFPDPSADESLPDQSRKALSYAYARFQDPLSWKFNKAKQIWLIKRLWLEEMIPEKYFALVTKYLANAEGRIRDTLVQMCNSEIASTTMDTSVEPAARSTDPSDGGSVATTKVTRARSLLDTLSHARLTVAT